MATGYVDPNGDAGTNNWIKMGVEQTYHYQHVVTATRQPSNPGTTLGLIGTEDNLVDDFNMTTLTGVDSVSNVTVWVYGHKSNGGAPTQCEVDINIGGAQGVHAIGLTDSDSWKSYSYDGTWTSANLDGMTVRIISDVTMGGEVAVYDVYCVVTYTPTAGGGVAKGKMKTKTKFWGD